MTVLLLPAFDRITLLGSCRARIQCVYEVAALAFSSPAACEIGRLEEMTQQVAALYPRLRCLARLYPSRAIEVLTSCTYEFHGVSCRLSVEVERAQRLARFITDYPSEIAPERCEEARRRSQQWGELAYEALGTDTVRRMAA